MGGRPIRTTQGHVCWQLWKHPFEAVHLYWAYWRRKDYKDAACQRFWSQHFPICASAYFDENAELIAIRSVEHMAASVGQGKSGSGHSMILVIGNDIFSLVCDHLRRTLGDE